MKKNGKNEELQSRREFFKRAAKGALPILAGAALLSSPILSCSTFDMSVTCSFIGIKVQKISHIRKKYRHFVLSFYRSFCSIFQLWIKGAALPLNSYLLLRYL